MLCKFTKLLFLRFLTINNTFKPTKYYFTYCCNQAICNCSNRYNRLLCQISAVCVISQVFKFFDKENIARNLFLEDLLEEFQIISFFLMLSEQSLHLLHKAEKALWQLLRSALIHAKIISPFILESINPSLL